MNPVVSVGVVNFNGETYLDATLRAVLEMGGGVDEVVLVDGGSEDAGVDLVRRRFPGVRVVELGTNLGPGAARNTILREARNDRVLLLDNDVRPQPGCVEALVGALDAHPDAAVAMPAILYAHAPDTVQYLGADPHFLGTAAPLHADRPVAELGTRPHPVGTVISCCLLVDRSRLAEPPRFEEPFFFHFEDHEFGLRTTLSGVDCLAVPRARCLHGPGTIGISIRETGRYTPVRIRYTIRNRWLTMLTLYQGRTLLRLAPALAAFELAQFAGAIQRGWTGHWLWAVGSALRHTPYVLRRRAHLRRLRRRTDLEVLAGGAFPFNPGMHRSGRGEWARRGLDALSGFNWNLVRQGRGG